MSYYLRLSAMDLGFRLGDVQDNIGTSVHSWRRHQAFERLVLVSPELAELVLEVDDEDTRRAEDGNSEAARGALVALTALVNAALDEPAAYDLRADASADHLQNLDGEYVQEAYYAALEEDEMTAEDMESKQYTVIRERLEHTYPALMQQIRDLISDQKGTSTEFRKGMWLGTVQLLVAIDAVTEKLAGLDDGLLEGGLNGSY